MRLAQTQTRQTKQCTASTDMNITGPWMESESIATRTSF